MPRNSTLREQLEKMLDFTKMVTSWYGQVDNLSTPALLHLFRGGAMLAKFFGGGKPNPPKIATGQEKAGVLVG